MLRSPVYYFSNLSDLPDKVFSKVQNFECERSEQTIEAFSAYR